MRLRADQIEMIRQTVREAAGPAAAVRVFGSRLRDDARGGDVDLLLETDGRLGLPERARLLEAAERCVHFLLAVERKLPWPLDGAALQRHKTDELLFERLAAYNERFAKLQDTLGAAMRHACLLAAEDTQRFLKMLAHFEKVGALESVESWQTLRAVRNLAAHDCDTDYAAIAEHFNALHGLQSDVVRSAARFVRHCGDTLGIGPAAGDFHAEVMALHR